MVTISKVMAKLLFKALPSKEEAIDYFLSRLAQRLKMLSIHSSTKVAKVLFLKKKLVSLRLEESQKFIELYNLLAEDTLADWKELQNKWYSIKPAGQVQDILEALKNLEKDFDSKIFEISKIIKEYVDNLKNLEAFYNLNKQESKKIQSLISKLNKIPLISFKSFKDSLKSGKFLIIK